MDLCAENLQAEFFVALCSSRTNVIKIKSLHSISFLISIINLSASRRSRENRDASKNRLYISLP